MGTHVPGFWSWYGLVWTVLTLMFAMVEGDAMERRLDRKMKDDHWVEMVVIWSGRTFRSDQLRLNKQRHWEPR